MEFYQTSQELALCGSLSKIFLPCSSDCHGNQREPFKNLVKTWKQFGFNGHWVTLYQDCSKSKNMTVRGRGHILPPARLEPTPHIALHQSSTLPTAPLRHPQKGCSGSADFDDDWCSTRRILAPFQWMASIWFANESLVVPRIQVKLDKYQNCRNIISQTSLLSSYTGSETDAGSYSR